MHHLVPPFIVDKLRREESSGSFPCAALFVDISGFTSLTETLMQHGQYGAEILADVMRAVFTPLVHTVFEQHGFITGFAGDAFTAVFPEEAGRAAAELRALAAAWKMQQHMEQNARQETRFGSFDFSAKVGLANGGTRWGILHSADRTRAMYYFSGPAIDGCAEAEHHAQAGEIVCSAELYEGIQRHIVCQPIADFWRIEKYQSPLPAPTLVHNVSPDTDLASRFAPRFLLERDIEGEFRQILNLFVNVQGAPQGKELAAFIEHVFQLQDQYGGFLNRIDFGDKGCHLLLFWGAPLGHEHDLERVLDFVLELRQVSDLPLRAGITYRIAHAGFIGSELAKEYTCYGRGVNLAARQMTAAKWGEIWLDGETAQRASAQFHVEDNGLQTFKGFANAQRVYLLKERQADRESRFADKPLIGREQELAVLQAAVRPIFEGRFAGSMTIIGEAGVGKSHLIDTLYSPLVKQERAAVFLCQADELLRRSLNPFRYFLAHYFDYSPADADDVNKQRFFGKFDALLATVSDVDIRAEMERTQSFLANLIGLNWDDSLYNQLDPELRFENTLESLKTFVKAESMRRPVILHLEDAHWWDRDTVTFLSRLVRNVDEFPILLVITSREPLPDSLFDSSTPQAVLHLQRLGQDALAEMVETILGRAPTAALQSLLLERTEGNPFFVEQVLLYLQENDLLEEAGTDSGRMLKEDTHVPTDVRAVLTARLDRLPIEIKDLVQKASILGHEFDTPILAAMVGGDSGLESALTSGERERMWLPSGRSSYIFRHALLRDAAYDMQLGSRLRQLHGHAARAYETQYPEPARPPHYAEIAFHFDRAEEITQARGYYGAAGRYAKGEYSNENAVAHFSRALALTEAEDFQTRYRYLKERETIFQWLGRRENQKHDLDQISEILTNIPDPRLMADLDLRKSSFALVLGDYKTAEVQVRNALANAQSTKDPLVEARVYHRWGRTLWQQGRSKEARSLLEKAIAYAEGKGDESLLADCFVDLAGVLRQEGYYHDARRYLERAAEAFAKQGNEQGSIRCLTLFGVVNSDLGFYSTSETDYLRALKLARETGWRFAEASILANLGGAQFELGNLPSSSDYLHQALLLAEETGDLRAQAVSQDTLGLIAHYNGDPQAALRYFDRAIEITRSIDNSRELGFALTHAGYAAVDLELYGRAKADLEEALRLREELGAAALQIDTLAGLAHLALATHDQDHATALADEIVLYTTQNGSDGIELPVLVHLICFKAFAEANRADPAWNARARQALEAGNALVEQLLERLPDETMRERFLRSLPYNLELRELWLAQQS